MVQIIAGTKGKGKTQYMLDMANAKMAAAKGSVAYLDKSTRHMFELDRNIRLINVFEYPIQSVDAFIGFVCGIICQDHDLEAMFLDGFMKLTGLSSPEDIEKCIRALVNMSARYGVDFTVSIAMDKVDMPLFVQEQVVVSL